MFKTLSSLVALTLIPSTFAAVLTLTPGEKTLEGRNIPQSAQLKLSDRSVELSTVGFGLRSKKVMVANVKVYVAELLVSNAAAFEHHAANDAALKSLDKMEAVAIRMDFVRTVEAAKVAASFVEALNANQVDTRSAQVQAFISAVENGGDAAVGKALTIAFDTKGSLIVYENADGSPQIIKADANLQRAIYSIWLGVPADAGLANLKKDLIGE